MSGAGGFIWIDRQRFTRPVPCTRRVLLALVKKSPDTHDLYAQYDLGDGARDILFGLDEEAPGTTFYTFPKVVNGG